MPNRENLETSHSADESLRKRREMITKAKSKSLNPSEKCNEEELTAENDNEVNRTNSDKKGGRYKSQKLKMKIKRQASLEEQFPIAATGKPEETGKSENDVTAGGEDLSKNQEKKQQFHEELKVPKIEIMRKNGVDDGIKVKEYAILSPNSSKLRERFSKSKFLRQDSKNLNVELSKSSDSGIGVSRSTEDDPMKSSESVIFRFFDIGPDTRLNKSDSERSPNFLDTVSLFTRSRSHERSVSSDSSDKNLSDLDKPSIKIRKRHEYLENRDSSSSYEGNIFDAHISNRVRKLHEVALKQMSEESAKNQKVDAQKRSVEFKYPVEFGSYDSIQGKTPPVSKVRKFKSLDRTDSNNQTESLEDDDDDQNSGPESLNKGKTRLKKQDRFAKRLSLKSRPGGVLPGLSSDRKKDKRCRGFLKSRKDAGEDESDENADSVDGWSDPREKESKVKEVLSKRLSRKDKKASKKTKRALSEEHRGSRKERSLLFSITGGKRRSDSETRHGRKEVSDEEPNEESELSEKAVEAAGDNFVVKNEQQDSEIRKNLNTSWAMPKKIFSMRQHRNDFFTTKLDMDRNRTSLDFVEIGSYLEVVGKIWPMSDDYKIVFISSDSSTKENRSISTDSDTGSAESGTDSSKRLVSECDWDYFDTSSIVRPVIKDWNWHGSPRSFTGTLLERSSPVFSTSDDNSPKFPRRSLGRFSVRDSPVFYDADVGRLSPNPQRKATDVEEAKFRSADCPNSTDVNDDSHAEENKIEIAELKASPPIKSKDFHKAKQEENGNNKKEIQAETTTTTTTTTMSATNADAKPSDETKKSKKRRKNKKLKKGNAKDEDAAENQDEITETPLMAGKKGNKRIVAEDTPEEDKHVVNEVRPLPGSPMRNLSRPTEELTVTGNNLSPDGVNLGNPEPTVGSVEGTEPQNTEAKKDSNGNSVTKGKGKSKKQKNKKCEKCGSAEPKSNDLCRSGANDLPQTADSGEKPGGLLPNEFTFQAGSFGFQPQNLLSQQTPCPGVLAYNCPISNVLGSTSVFQNFVPIPVPVLIPVPFPVPTTIWSENCQNFCFSNLNIGTENFDIFNNLQNICNPNYRSQTRNEGKEVSFDVDKNNSSGSGSSSIHIKPINMQRPALGMGPLPIRSQGSVNSAGSDLTCLTSREHPLSDKEEETRMLITAESVDKNDGNQEVLPDDEDNNNDDDDDEEGLTKKGKKKSKDVTGDNKGEGGEDSKDEYPAVGDAGSSEVPKPDCPAGEESKSDRKLSKIFVEGKTFRDIKNSLKHKSDLIQRVDSPIESKQVREQGNKFESIKSEGPEQANDGNGVKNVIVIDGASIDSESIDSSLLLNIDKKLECSSTSHSEDSDENCRSRKPFRKCYYFNGCDSEGKTSDDSDIADLNSSEEETKTENSSQGNSSSASEDEGNPDSSRFSEVYVVNPLEPESDLTDVGGGGSSSNNNNNSIGRKATEEMASKKWNDESDTSKTRRENKKLRNMLPLKNFPVSDDTDDSDSGGRESSVVLLKHIKKLTEDESETPVGEKTNRQMKSPEKADTCASLSEPEKKRPEEEEEEAVPAERSGETQRLPNRHKSGVAAAESQDEDPVSLVSQLAASDSESALVGQSEIVPGSVHEVLFNSNSSEPVSSEINSVPFEHVVEKKIGASSSALENANGTHRKDSENGSSNKSAECLRYLRDRDVSCNANSEVIKSNLLKEILPTHFSSSGENDEVNLGKNRGCTSPRDNSSESRNNDRRDDGENGQSLLDKIESRIRLFSQLDNLSVSAKGNEAKYTSLIMINQDKNEKFKCENLANGDSVKVITTNTTKVWNKENARQSSDDICLKHTNRKSEDDESSSVYKLKSLEDYYTMTLENSRGLTISPKKPNVIKNMTPLKEEDEVEGQVKEEVQVVTDDKTLSAVICLEEGLADDDSWVEDLEKDRENDFANSVTEEESSSDEETQIGACIPVHTDREEELRGYHRGAINFTLHTIVEESCEESEVEDKTKSAVQKKRPTSVTELEKYFYFDIGGGVTPNFESQDLDTFSESSSSIYSDSGVIDDTSGEARENPEQNQLSTSRLEKYFLNFDRDGREKESDGSVGSDSEGPPSPEQKRKRLFRARASNRLHSNSLDNLVQSENEQQSADVVLDSEDSSTETDMPEPQGIDKSDDSVKRKKKRKMSGGSSSVPVTAQEASSDHGGKENRESLTREHRHRETKEDFRGEVPDGGLADENKNGSFDQESDDERSKTPQPDSLLESGMNRDKQQSRDSGFIGSCDDLLKDQKTGGDSSGSDTKKKSIENNSEKQRTNDGKDVENCTTTTTTTTAAAAAAAATMSRQQTTGTTSTPPATSLTRKDSFNNWSSDEETNLMMSKMRQFFKAMVSIPKTANKMPENSNPSSPQVKTKGVKSPQLVYFENELTRLMKTVPGIRDDQVREIVEYLSSEDTWSDSYDSSDYTSSDLEGTAAAAYYHQRTQLQQEISESCKQIIDKFDQSKTCQEPKPKVPPRRNSSPMNRETALVYQKLVASFNKITNENENPSSTPSHSSPPLFAKVMHHIGSRLVALMHEVSSNSSGEGSISSHKSRYHKRISQKLSNVSSTTEEDCGLTDESDSKGEEGTTLLGQNLPYFHLLHQLPRSKSHDLLLDETKVKSLRSSSSGVSDIVEEKEASDYERFSWRGSFESALMADSRSKLTLLSNDSHSSNTTLAAKRRSAGDLLFLKSLSREQLDRVRSCGSIGGVAMEDKNIWTTGRERNGRRRSSVPDAASPGSGASADGDEDSSDSEIIQERSITLPRSLQSISSSQNTNSLPRLPTTGTTNTQNLSKAQSVQHFLPNAKSARYRPPGFNRIMASSPKRAVSAPGLQLLQPSLARRERRRNYLAGNASLSGDELNNLECSTGPHGHGGSKSASPSPIVGSARSRLHRGPSSIGSPDWSATDEIQRLVALDQQRQSTSSLGARSDSMASVYSGAGEGRSCSIPVRGEVEFGLQYNYKAGDLEIYVKQCRDLAAVDTKRNRSDPYVKVYLLPDKSKSGKRKTKVKKHTLNPIFDEVLKFHISLNGLETRTLWLTVWHSDMFGRNDFLGEVMMSLENKVFDDPKPQSYTLQERTEPFEDVLSYKGEIIIGLKFVPPDASTLQKKGKRSKGALNVKVKEAKNLTAIKGNGVSDPFCKSYLLPDKGRNSKQKTPVQRRTCNPSWNHTFVYEDVSLQDLSERCLELTVWDHDRLASNEFLGGLRFSLGSGRHNGKSVDWMDSTGKEVSLWQSMLEKPNLWVEGCLSLRASLDPPNSLT